MRLTVIGCAGSFPNPRSAASCYLVEHDGTTLVLDLGNGALGPLAAQTDLRTLDAIALSHLHADHCMDLTSLYVARKYHPLGPPTTPVVVHGPTGTRQRITDAYRAAVDESAPDLDLIYRFVDHAPEPVRIGTMSLTVAPVAHPVEAYALRVEADGRALVFSGDTAATPTLVDLSRGADLALYEASFLTGPHNPPNLHMTAAQAAEHAAAAGVPRLLLTHLIDWNDPAESLAESRAVYNGELALAAPGMGVEL